MARTQRRTFVDGPITYDPIVSRRRRLFTAVATLTADDTGALCLFSTAAGYTYTLPTCERGLHFTFIVQTTITSVGAKIMCASGDFLVGTILQGTDGTFTQAAVTANGTTHVSWNGNGSTTGGIIGDYVEVVGLGNNQWVVYGQNTATGTEATPFATS